MNLDHGDLIRHKKSGTIYRFIGYGMSYCFDSWCVAAFYQNDKDIFSQPIERFDERFEEVEG